MITIKTGVWLHLKLFNIIYGKLNPFSCPESCNDLLCVSQSLPRYTFALRLIHYFSNFVHLTQGFLLWKLFNRNGSHLSDGNTLLTFGVWAIVSMTGHIYVSFARQSSGICTVVVNCVLNADVVRASGILKGWMCSIPFVYISVALIYMFLTATTNLEPISTTVSAMNLTWKHFPLMTTVIKTLMLSFENFYFALQIGLGCIVVYQGMVACYIALYLRTKELVRDAVESKEFLVNKYNSLQICSILINDCFQHSIALQFKFVVIILSVLFGTITCHTGIRNDLSAYKVFIAAYLWVCSYWMMICGYYLPGKVNSSSKRILHIFKQNLFVGFLTKLSGLSRCKVIKSLRSIRIQIGSTNYYESITALNILDFVLLQTVNMILLV